MVFLVKVSIVLLILISFYKLVLERESFFNLNRYFLLGGLLAAFLLPAITLPELINHQGVVTDLLEKNSFRDMEFPVYTPIESEAATLPQRTGDPNIQTKTNTLSTGEPAGFGYWLALLYGFGVVVLSGRLLLQVAEIFKTVRRAKDVVEDTGCTIVNVKDECGPRSFFKYIFLNPEQYKPETYEHILEHEKIHVRERHSLDLLISEVAIIVLWFNPLIWMFRKEVEKNLEYQTDAMMLDTPMVEPKKYQMSLLHIGVVRKPLTIVSNYNHSLIKKRILMMNAKKSNGHGYWKYAFIAPTLFITLLVLNPPFTIEAQDKAVTNPAAKFELFNMDFGSDNDRNPLLEAVWTGNFKSVKKLVEEGANVNLIQHGEGTPLILAISRGESEITRFLLENGANPNLGTSNDGYPLRQAVGNGDVDLVRLLVKRGADVNAKYDGDGSALIQAAQSGYLPMVRVLAELNADVNMAVEGDGNPLIQAARGGHTEIVKYLVASGADVNREVQGDETPLINASAQGHLAIVKYLVEKGADVNKICSEWHFGTTRIRTALKMAKENGHGDVISYLKSKGAQN